MRQILRASSIQGMRTFAPLIGPNVRALSWPRLPSPNGVKAGTARWLAVAAGLIGGCAAPKIEIGDCHATCEATNQCQNDMVCSKFANEHGQRFCVHNENKTCGSGAAGAAGRFASGGAGAISGGGNNATTGGSNAAGGTAGEGANAGGSESGGTAGAGAIGGTPGSGGTTETGGTPGSGGTLPSGGTSTSSGTTTTDAGAPGTGGTPGTVGTETAVGGSTGGTTSVGGDAGNAGLGGAGGITSQGGGAGASQGGAGGWAGAPNGAAAGAAGSCNVVVTTTTVKDACLGEVYEASLLATGGSNYTWSATGLPGDLDLTLSSAGVLSGVIKKTGDFVLDVTARDTVSGCVSEPKQIPLTVLRESATECPKIHIKNKSTSALAPAACQAWPYSAELDVTGGTSGYTWEAIGLPATLTFDSMTQKVTGNPTAGLDLKVRVTDHNGTGRTVERTFPIPLREKCWFGYISDESGATRLHLFDPLLGTRLQRPENNQTNLVVEDFQFSPNGKFVAYRVHDTTDDSHKLWLWQGPQWGDHESELSLDGSITHYAWSNNALVLAAAITTTDDSLLGGVNVVAVPDNPTSSGIQGLLQLDAVSAPVDSDITWYGGDEYVAFHTPETPGETGSFRIVNYTAYGAGGFSSSVTSSLWSYDPSILLYPTANGFFLAEGVDSYLEYFPKDNPVSVYHGNAAVAPSGAYTALTAGGQLRLFRAIDQSVVATDVPHKVADGCTSLLAWSKQQERVACVDEGASTIRLETLNEIGSTLATATVANSDAYVHGTRLGYKRVMSPSGNWLALTTNDSVFMASLAQPNPAVIWANSAAGTAGVTELDFSPDERFLALFKGKTFLLYDVASPAGRFFLPVVSLGTDVEPCQEETLTVPSWCGRAKTLAQAKWSPGSDLLAVVLDDGTLQVKDLRLAFASGVLDPVQVTSDCSVSCVGGFRFQP
jgi:hypothetical protein